MVGGMGGRDRGREGGTMMDGGEVRSGGLLLLLLSL